MVLEPLFAASGAVALRTRPLARAGLLPRVLGLYVAVSAGTIQLLDIVVDRLALPERLFLFAIILAAIGLPIIATVTVLYDVARADRRPPRAAGVTADASARALAPPLQQAAEDDAATPIATRDATSVSARLELALSYRRIAEIQKAAGAHEEADAQHAAFAREARSIIAELHRLIDGGV